MKPQGDWACDDCGSRRHVGDFCIDCGSMNEENTKDRIIIDADNNTIGGVTKKKNLKKHFDKLKSDDGGGR